MPWSMLAAAISRSTPSGTGTTRSAAITTCSAYPVWGVIAQATRSPTETPSTPAPTAETVPAPSLPATKGSGRG